MVGIEPAFKYIRSAELSLRCSDFASVDVWQEQGTYLPSWKVNGNGDSRGEGGGTNSVHIFCPIFRHGAEKFLKFQEIDTNIIWGDGGAILQVKRSNVASKKQQLY